MATPLIDPAWQTFVEEAPDPMFVTDVELAIVSANRAGRELLGGEEADLAGKRLDDLLSASGEAIAALDRTAVRSGRAIEGTYATARAGGERIVVELRARKVTDDRVVVNLRDATAHHVAVERLGRSEASFRALTESSPDGVVAHRDGLVRYANPAMARMLGWGDPRELIGHNVIELVQPDDRARVAERIRTLKNGEATVPFTEERLVCKDGSTLLTSIAGLSCHFDGEPMVVAIVRDVTERRRLDRQMHQAERMASLGALSAGVAHEINNPLTYLILRLDIITSIAERAARLTGATMDPGDDRARLELSSLIDDLATHVVTAKEGAQRVRTIVQDLRVFAQADREMPLPVDIHGPIELAIGLATHELKQRATVVRSFTRDAFVMASEGKLAQVFLHLLLNAAQSMSPGSTDRHEVKITTRVEGDRVVASVEDTGTGIPSEHLARIFEPFFTTKAPGVGSGLGLSMCHGIISSLGGTIHVETRAAGAQPTGTKFTIDLPLSAGLLPASIPPQSLQMDWAPVDCARVLVCHPSLPTRMKLEGILAAYGEVVAVASAEVAIGLVKSGAPFDLVVAPAADPASGTPSLRDALGADDPELAARVIELSGDPSGESSAIDADALRRRIESVLEHDRATPSG